MYTTEELRTKIEIIMHEAGADSEYSEDGIIAKDIAVWVTQLQNSIRVEEQVRAARLCLKYAAKLRSLDAVNASYFEELAAELQQKV
jgi:hypothetical protein